MTQATLNEPWEKSLQHLEATITGLNASLTNLHVVIDAMPDGMLLPGDMAVLEMRANDLTDLIFKLMKTHTTMGRKIRKAESLPDMEHQP